MVFEPYSQYFFALTMLLVSIIFGLVAAIALASSSEPY